MVRMAQRPKPPTLHALGTDRTETINGQRLAINCLTNRWVAGLAVFLCVLHASCIRAEETPPVAALFAELDSDDFDTREKAERELRRSGPAALPALRAALENSPSVEVKTRLARIIPFITVEAESDPDKLMLASAEAAAKAQFATAARGYSKAALGFGELSTKTKSTSEFAELRVKQADAARRMKLMAVAGRCDKRVAEVLARMYPKLKTHSDPVAVKEGKAHDQDLLQENEEAGLDELISAMVAVASAGAFNQMEPTGRKLVILTTPGLHELIQEFLVAARERMKMKAE